MLQSQPFLHNLSLMNLDIVILEYGHDVSCSLGCLRDESYTLHQLDLEKLYMIET